MTAAELENLFPAALAAQELSTDRFILIPPEPIRDVYKSWRVTPPLLRASRLERALNTRARIYLKYEGASLSEVTSPTRLLRRRITTRRQEWTSSRPRLAQASGGSALAFAGAMFDLNVEVWQVRASYESKPYRRYLMELYGGRVHSSPSSQTATGRAILSDDPNTPGSLGMAVSEAVEVALAEPRVRYALGSVLNHVVLHQSVIGQEAIAQLREQGGEATADVVIGCAGGGSNLAGLSFPFLREVLTADASTRVIAAEPSACPSLTRG